MRPKAGAGGGGAVGGLLGSGDKSDADKIKSGSFSVVSKPTFASKYSL